MPYEVVTRGACWSVIHTGDGLINRGGLRRCGIIELRLASLLMTTGVCGANKPIRPMHSAQQRFSGSCIVTDRRAWNDLIRFIRNSVLNRRSRKWGVGGLDKVSDYRPKRSGEKVSRLCPPKLFLSSPVGNSPAIHRSCLIEDPSRVADDAITGTGPLFIRSRVQHRKLAGVHGSGCSLAGCPTV